MKVGKVSWLHIEETIMLLKLYRPATTCLINSGITSLSSEYFLKFFHQLRDYKNCISLEVILIQVHTAVIHIVPGCTLFPLTFTPASCYCYVIPMSPSRVYHTLYPSYTKTFSSLSFTSGENPYKNTCIPAK